MVAIALQLLEMSQAHAQQQPPPPQPSQTMANAMLLPAASSSSSLEPLNSPTFGNVQQQQSTGSQQQQQQLSQHQQGDYCEVPRFLFFILNFLYFQIEKLKKFYFWIFPLKRTF